MLTLGEEAAFFGGVEVRRALWVLGGIGCLLAAAAVAQCGLVGFVGLAGLASRSTERQQVVSGIQLVVLTIGLGFSVRTLLAADSYYAAVQAVYPAEWSRIQAEVIPMLEEVQASKSR